MTAADTKRVADVATKLAGSETKLATWLGEQRRWDQQQAQVLLETKAIARKKELEASVEVLKLAVAKIKALRADLVAKLLAGFLGPARRFTDGILPGTLEVKDGELGYYAGPQWVSHEVFSGTEEALAYAGLGVALAQEASVKLVMIDELGIIDAVTRVKAVARMQELVAAGFIDQFVGADVNDGAMYREIGVAVTKVG